MRGSAVAVPKIDIFSLFLFFLTTTERASTLLFILRVQRYGKVSFMDTN